ncbi:MAG: CPBP family intramembrane metalloprotease [Myxococcales bacterium]|nr:CPBP family intramembrane metalloprotease [Myxococcales bacterium]
MKDARFGHGFWPYLLPYFAFLLLSEVGGRLPEGAWLAVLALKPLVPAALVAYFWRRGMYPELRGFGARARGLPLDLLVGAASGALWMAPYLLLPADLGEGLGSLWPDRSAGFDPARAGASLAPLALALRFVGYAGVTPVFEELFIRSFVMRYAEVFDRGGDFRDVPVARYTPRGLWVSAVFFVLGHVFWEWWVALPWVLATSAYFYWRGHLGAVVAAHAAANATILVAAVLADGPLWFFV